VLTLTHDRHGYCRRCRYRCPLDAGRLCLVCRANSAALRRVHRAALALVGALVRRESGHTETAVLDWALCELDRSCWTT
jgi:hypothetical protein